IVSDDSRICVSGLLMSTHMRGLAVSWKALLCLIVTLNVTSYVLIWLSHAYAWAMFPRQELAT
ncbi:hypothetical protein PIB30_113827, partial [Stylosanthes scabra]|nr:hypothetical protein [Stylosanthes scabra]